MRKYVIFGLVFVLGFLCAYLLIRHAPDEKYEETLCSSLPSYLVLEESESPESSSDSCWWLDSGAYFLVDRNVGSTLHGALDGSSKWKQLYAAANSRDTQNGAYPQNIFRLVSKKQWQNVKEETFFAIDAYHNSSSLNRNGTNGVFLLSRYINADNLYLAGVRVDGTAVIKRKLGGVYETLATAPLSKLFNGGGTYDKYTNPILLPMSYPIGISMETINESNSSVSIKLKISYDGEKWTEILSVADSPSNLPGGSKLMGVGGVGIRTDFMDVSFPKFIIR